MTEYSTIENPTINSVFDTCRSDLAERLNACADDYWGELACEAADRIEKLEAQCEALQNKCARRGLSPEDSDALQAENERLRAAGAKMLAEYEAADDFHSGACTNWTACEVSTHQCGSCDMREALAAQE